MKNICANALSQVHSQRVMETEGTIPEGLSVALYLMNVRGGYFGSGLVSIKLCLSFFKNNSTQLFLPGCPQERPDPRRSAQPLQERKG